MRWLPVRKPSIAWVRSRIKREGSTSNSLKTRFRSPSGCSASLSNQCSTSTLWLLLDRHSPAADCSEFKQVVLSVLTSAPESIPILQAPVALAAFSDTKTHVRDDRIPATGTGRDFLTCLWLTVLIDDFDLNLTGESAC